MKNKFKFFLLFLIIFNLFYKGQNKELVEFSTLIRDFNSCKEQNKCDNETKIWKEKINKSFLKFIVTKNEEYFNTIENNGYNKYIIDKNSAIFFRKFNNNAKVFFVYSYQCPYTQRYFVTNDKGTVLYQSNNSVVFVENIIPINHQNTLIVEDITKGKKATIFNEEWNQIEAFKGNAFGFNGPYLNKKFVEKRKSFNLLGCEHLPLDRCEIQYDFKDKTLSYKQYKDSDNFKVVISEWINNMFEIDDYSYDDMNKTDPLSPSKIYK